jgi:hypothetical protein
LVNNFTFLNSLVAGNFWVQLGMIQQSPNLYDVVVPGRFHKYFCAIGIEVDYVGKCRTNETAVEEINRAGGPDVNLSEKDMLFPDAYKITISVRDLSPNNFNLFLENMNIDKVTLGSGTALSRDDLIDIKKTDKELEIEAKQKQAQETAKINKTVSEEVAKIYPQVDYKKPTDNEFKFNFK